MGFYNWLKLVFKNAADSYAMEERYLKFACALAIIPILLYCVSMLILLERVDPLINHIDQVFESSPGLEPILAFFSFIVAMSGMLLSSAIGVPIMLYVMVRLGKLTAQEARNIYIYSYYPTRWFPNDQRPSLTD